MKKPTSLWFLVFENATGLDLISIKSNQAR